MKKSLTLVLSIVLSFGAFTQTQITVNSSIGQRVAAQSYATDDIVINVANDITMTMSDIISIPALADSGRTVTIRSANPTMPAVLLRSGQTGTLFTVSTNATLILENIIIDGGSTFSTSQGSLVRVNNATLIMNDGAIARNNHLSNSAIRINAGMFIMNGGEISGNRGGNDFTASGVHIEANGKFIMNGGRINNNINNFFDSWNNQHVGSGGGVHIATGSAFVMNNGEIINNSAVRAAGVFVSSGRFTMYSGVISNNTSGGGVSLGHNASFTLGGTAVITGNSRLGVPRENVTLGNNQHILLSTSNPPATGMNIGITKFLFFSNGIFVESGATEEQVLFFTADVANAAVFHNAPEGELQLGFRVTNITDVPTEAISGTPLTLTGTVMPNNAVRQTVVWSVYNAGTTGATITNDYTLNTTNVGTVTIRATIIDGLGTGFDYTQDFTIEVSSLVNAENPIITEQPQSATYSQHATATALTVVADSPDGGVLSYQWFSNTTKSTVGGTAIDGATTANFVPSTEVVGTFYFFVIVTNSVLDNGGTKTATATSNVATVVITLPILPNGCNQNTPGWGESLGTISFATNNTWRVGNQIWSDAVQTTVCSSRAPSGMPDFSWGNWLGVDMNFNANCRSNPGQRGDLFSWCAVVRFADLLCPYPWRVPTREDFVALDLALGGEGGADGRYRNVEVRNKYLNVWGGTYSGIASNFGILWSQGTDAMYWTQSQADATSAYRAGFCHVGWIFPQGTSNKASFALALRCIRDPINAEVPNIIQQPQSAIYSQHSTADKLTVVANSPDGGALSYQWFSNTTNSTVDGTAIDGATTANFVPSTEVVGTFYFFVIVTNSVPDNGGTKTATATSDVAIIQIIEGAEPPPPLINISVSANPPTGGVVSGDGTNIAYGTSVTLNAVANADYNFINWTESGTIVSTNVSYTFTATNSRTLIANFELIDTPDPPYRPDPPYPPDDPSTFSESEIFVLWDRLLAVSNPESFDELRNATYRWFKNDVLLPQSSGYWIDVGSPIPAGRYSVSVHYAGVEILFLERIFSQPFGVLASPNPIGVFEELTIETHGTNIERIEVFDMNGVLLNTIICDKARVNFQTTGVHILRIHLENQAIEILRIVVQ